MNASPIAIFVAGFVAGGLILGGSILRAESWLLDRVHTGGVVPGQTGTLFCTNANHTLRVGFRGHIGNVTASAQIGGPAYGVSLHCPA